MSEDGPYAAVTLILGEDWHCRLSGAVEGELFLLPEAPELPLSGCSDSSQCRCQYQHFPDRRIGARREADEGVFQFWDLEERRHNGGRRASDRASPYPW